MLHLLIVGTALALVFHVGLLPDVGKVLNTPSSVHAYTLVDEYDDSKLDESHIHDKGPKNTPLSISYGYTGSVGISVQENITQDNVCSSNIAYCYNEVDNDFHVNPP
jgi:hypothetical protein